jgi:hypothetical protein
MIGARSVSMPTSRYNILAERTKSQYPRFNRRPRDESWLKPVFWLLAKVTGTDYSTFHTTIFSTMYTGPRWEEMSDFQQYKLLRHELKHIRQAHEFPLGRWAWPVNHLLWAICYLLCLPFLWTFRSKFEREGYTQSLLVDFEENGELSTLTMEDNARWMANTFGGSAYAWMWTKKKAYAWAMDVQRKINAAEITNPLDRVAVGTEPLEKGTFQSPP